MNLFLLTKIKATTMPKKRIKFIRACPITSKVAFATSIYCSINYYKCPYIVYPIIYRGVVGQPHEGDFPLLHYPIAPLFLIALIFGRFGMGEVLPVCMGCHRLHHAGQPLPQDTTDIEIEIGHDVGKELQILFQLFVVEPQRLHVGQGTDVRCPVNLLDVADLPKYLACPGGISLPRTLADVSLLISGGVKGLLIR